MNKIGKILSFVLFFVFFMSIAVFSSEQKYVKVVPAKSVGPLTIGDSFFKYQNTFGNPDFRKELQNGDVIAKYNSHGLIIQYQGYTGEMHYVGVMSNKIGKLDCHTAKGIHVGMDKRQIEGMLGVPEKVIQVTSKDVYPDSDKLAIYPKKGISFHYDIYGKSVIMFVFSPAMFGK